MSLITKLTSLAKAIAADIKAMIFDDLVVNGAAAGTLSLNVGAAQVFNLTLSGNTTINFTNVPVPVGQSYSWLVRVTQGSTARTLNINGVNWLTSGATYPGAPAANKIIEYIFSTENGTKILGRKGAFT